MPRDTLKSLRAELDAVRAELAGLRAWQASHVCVPAAPVAQQCTCNTSVVCQVHTHWRHTPWLPSTTWINPYQTYWQTTAAAAPCPSSTFTYNTYTAGANPVPFQMPTTGAAGAAAAGQTFMLTTGGGECE